MILIGVLAICAVSGVLLHHRPGGTRGPGEPTGSYTPPPAPVPSPPPAAGSPPPAPAPAPVKPSQPLPTTLSVGTPAPVSPVRRSRNSGFNRFAAAPVRTRA